MTSNSDDSFSLPGHSISGGDLLGKKNEKPKSYDEIFKKRKDATGGGAVVAASISRRKSDEEQKSWQTDQNSSAKQEDEKEPVSEPKPKPLTVSLSNAKWDRGNGHFNGKATAHVDADLPPDQQHLTQIRFTLFAILPDGKRERIDERESHLKSGHAEADFILYRSKRQHGQEKANYFFSAKHTYSKEKDSSSLLVEAINCKDIPDPAPQEKLGTCPYYPWRHGNFIDRHQSCHRMPPEYYMSYGYKYCVLFSTETSPKLSDKGKKWLKRARRALQDAMEKGLKLNPNLEMNSDAFTTFAFGTHSKAYWNSGLGDLSLIDLIHIGFTPDIKEWLDGRSRAQAYDIGGRLVEAWAKEIEQTIYMRSIETAHYFRNILK